MTTFAIASLGCKVNTYETQGYETALQERGFKEVSFKEVADVYIINTCAVTNTAAAKSRQKINQAISRNQNALIAVVGCYVQTSLAEVEQMEHVDIMVGSDGKALLADMIVEGLKRPRIQKQVHDVRLVRAFEALPIRHFEHQTRAFLKIQDGCNQFCSYCIIPYARGAERSLPEDDVLSIAHNLCESGHREIVLSGIHTGRYGHGVQSSLLQLLQRLTKEVPKLQRIRISSIEMNEVSDELLLYMQSEPKIARHLHIPIQSANNQVLKHMNRPYRVEWFMERINYIRSLMPNISISSDVIVAFPQESEADFMDSYEHLKQMQFSFMHIFPYSKREGSKAAQMSGHLSNQVKKERAATLAQLSKALYTSYKQSFIGKDVSLLLEKQQDGMLVGHTSEYLEVYVPGDSSQLHNMIDVTLETYDNERLIARIKEDVHEIVSDI